MTPREFRTNPLPGPEPVREAPVTPRPATWLEGTSAYRVPRHPAPVALNLDGNEGAEPPAELLEALAAQLPGVLRRYPSTGAVQAAWAARLGVAAERVVITAGADEALERTMRAYLGPGREAIVPAPTFEMLERYARAAGGAVAEVAWPAGAYPVDAVLARVGPQTGVICVVTPNNPTGAVATADDVERLAAAAPHAVVLVDLAYVEFAAADPTDRALALPNVVVARTLSKAWGLAGLRVGCAVAAPEVAGVLRAAGSPYTVAGPSLALAAAWLERGAPDVARFVGRVRTARERIASALRRAGADPLPSEANFVLARFRDPHGPLFVRDGLAGLGIAVRAFPGRPGLEDAVRISCPGDPAGVDRLCEALLTVLRPEALLFDLDGVLADVSGSFREAVLQTAASYGVTLAPGDVSRAKAAGGANNDWELTRRLMLERGTDRPLFEVIQRFESVYQDAPGRPGLRRTETLLVPRERLLRWRARLRLAIVTGRPRADAERFLREHGIDDLFETVVAMEDAPLKPDPAPVRLALSRLGAGRAWMIGDTVDDVRAARGAGVVPYAVLAPGEDAALAAPALAGAGAARVLDRTLDLEELLP